MNNKFFRKKVRKIKKNINRFGVGKIFRLTIVVFRKFEVYLKEMIG